MNIEPFVREFIEKSKYKPYKSICENLLVGGNSYSLNSQTKYEESEYLAYNIRESVRAYTRDKDNAIELYKDFIEFLSGKGVEVDINFPTISISSSFDRQLFIAKYLQNGDSHVSELGNILWVSSRTIDTDLKSLRGEKNPISVNGKQFTISEMNRSNDKVQFASTAHPLFLTENLTQVLIMLKGLKAMSENPLYHNYAFETAVDIWGQLSNYARQRIKFVVKNLIPDELDWYESLNQEKYNSFLTEKECRCVNNIGPSVVLDCYKNEKSFCVEYYDNGESRLYDSCRCIPGTLESGFVDVKCPLGELRFELSNIVRSAYSIEELLID